MPLVSVIIPAYNRSKSILRALDSVLCQEGFPFEILVGDDASTDDTVEVLLGRFPSAKVARLPENRGAASARNAAMRMAAGEYLAFLDTDDEWLPGKIALQLAYMERNPEVGACACGHWFVLRDGRERCVAGEGGARDWKKRLHFAQSFHGASTPLVRRKVIEEIGGQDERLRVLEDWDWMLRIAGKYPVNVLEEPLVRIHENSPSAPDATVASTEYFLKKHGEGIGAYGARHRAEVFSQQWENAARNLYRHGRYAEADKLLLRSFGFAPWRNPASLAAVPFSVCDRLLGTRWLPKILAFRSGLSDPW